MRPLTFAALSIFALALTGCDALAGLEAASAAPTANNGSGYYGSGYDTPPPCDDDNGGGTLGSGTDEACTPDPE